MAQHKHQMQDLRSQSSKPLQQVDLNQPSCNSNSSSNNNSSTYAHENDVELVLSSSGHHLDYEVKFGNETDPYKDIAITSTPNFKLPFLVFVWQLMTRATIGVFVLINDTDKHQDTQPLMFMVTAMLTLLNMLLLSVLKDRKKHNVACAYAVFSAVESVVLVLFPDFLWLVLPILVGVWLLIFIVSINPFYMCYKWCKGKMQRRQQQHPIDDAQFIYMHRKQTWWSRQNFLYIRVIWFLFLSILCEACNLIYFWFLMHLFENETDLRKQRIILCCLNLKLLMTTYTRHMLFERKFSYLAMLSEFILFATTSTIVYCYTFLTLTQEQYLILHYTFWCALGLEILVNFIMFVAFSVHAL